jgi:pimeloyl-ACP methyl ester carboxylesterase
MLVDLVRTTTPDRMRLDGALHVAPSPGTTFDLAICLHGVQSNFYSSSLIEGLVEPLIQQGISVLRVNTRGHDGVTAATVADRRRWQGAAFEIVDESRHDVQGWLAWAKDHGYQRVLLLGHSLGAVKCLYTAAYEELPLVAGIAAVSPPRLSYAYFREGFDNDKFFESIAIAESFVQQRKPDAIFQAKFPLPLFITANGYLDKYGPRERYNFLNYLAQVHVPILMVYGTKELSASAAFSGIREAIAELDLPTDRFHLVTIEGADHVYNGQHAALGGALVAWLQSVGHGGQVR